MFTMSQLRIGVAEFLFGSSRKPVIESHSRQSKSEFFLMLERLKIFYTEIIVIISKCIQALELEQTK